MSEWTRSGKGGFPMLSFIGPIFGLTSHSSYSPPPPPPTHTHTVEMFWPVRVSQNRLNTAAAEWFSCLHAWHDHQWQQRSTRAGKQWSTLESNPMANTRRQWSTLAALETTVEFKFSVALRPQRPLGLLGTWSLDFLAAPDL